VVSFRVLPPVLFRLDSLAALLESAFCGRDDKPCSMRETFVEFWKATYATITPPTEWPHRIQNCLRVSQIVSDTVVDVGIPIIAQGDEPDGKEVPPLAEAEPGFDVGELFDAEESAALFEEHHTDSESEEEEIPPERPPLFEFARKPLAIEDRKPTETSPFAASTSTTPPHVEIPMSLLGLTNLQILPFKLSPILQPPSTPIQQSKDYTETCTPPRPRKPFVPRGLPHSPASPIAPSVPPRHSPPSLLNKRTTNAGSARKHHISEDKENLFMTPVVESVLNKSPSPRKRASSEVEGDWNVSKRLKADTGLFASYWEIISFVDLITPNRHPSCEAKPRRHHEPWDTVAAWRHCRLKEPRIQEFR
jgi:hypothetical protein